MKLILQYASHIPASIYVFKVKKRNSGKRCEIHSKLIINTRIMTSMTSFFSVSIVDFEQVNFSWDVSEKPDLLPNIFEISRSSYDFV